MQIEIGKPYKLTFKNRFDSHETVVPSCYALSANVENGLTYYTFRISKSFLTVRVANTAIKSIEPAAE